MKIVKMCIVLFAVLTFACSMHGGTTSGSVAGPPHFRATATIQELMDSEFDPAADFIWGSVGTVITAAGVEDRQPRAIEQWLEVRRKAIILVEAANLLIMPERKVASEDFPSAGSGVLSSTEIANKIGNERMSFDAFAAEFRDVAVKQLLAVDRRDAVALSEAGQALDSACEACHIAFWYPHQIIPQLPEF